MVLALQHKKKTIPLRDKLSHIAFMENHREKEILIRNLNQNTMKTATNRVDNYDFIKGISIIFVILNHILSKYAYLPLHTIFTVQIAVPLFLIITILLRYKKLENINQKQYYQSIKKEILNVFIPFILATLFLIIALRPSLIRTILTLGPGWGAYYPFVYLQIILLAPFVFNQLKKNFLFTTILILFFCIITEILFTKLNISVWIYRVSFTRYCFLYVIAFMLYKKDLLSRYKTILIVLTILGAIFTYYNVYDGVNAFFYPKGWIGHRFPRDFVSLLWFISIYKLCDYTPTILKNTIVYLGKTSYDIFIVQLMFFAFTLPIDNFPLATIISLSLILICSYPWGILMNILRRKLNV